MKLRGRRVRSPDGERRASKIHRFRDLDPSTDVRIRALAQHFGVPLGSVVDAAIAEFFAHVMARVDAGTPGSGSRASAAACSELKTLEAWMQMRASDRQPPAESDDPGAADRSTGDGLAGLEADLAARRAKLKADLTQIA